MLWPQSVANEAIELASSGINPVLVVCPQVTTVAPDFLVSHFLANHYDGSSMLFVLPLLELLREHFREADIASPQVRPPTSTVRGKEKAVEEFKLICDWTFQPQKPRTRKGKQ